MSNYESFRYELAEKMLHGSCLLTKAVVEDALRIIDEVAIHYSITSETKEIAIAEGFLPPEVRQYIVSCGIEGQSKDTLQLKRMTYEMFFKEISKPINQITTNDIRMYLFSYKQNRNVSDRTIEGLRLRLNALFEWCTQNDFLTKNPAKQIKPIKYEKKQRQAMSRFDLEVFRSSAKDNLERALIDFIFSTGCRASEVCSVKLSDVDFEKRQVKIMGKGRKEKVVYLNDRAILSLKTYVNTRKAKSATVLFCTRIPPFKEFSRSAIERIIKNVENRCQLSVHVTPHVIRHTFATLALKAGMPLEQIQIAMGHESIDTTRIYAEISNNDVYNSHIKYVV